jgi:hypothetical protein
MHLIRIVLDFRNENDAKLVGIVNLRSAVVKFFVNLFSILDKQLRETHILVEE